MAQSVSVRTLVLQESRYIICENGSLSVSLSPVSPLLLPGHIIFLFMKFRAKLGSHAVFACPPVCSLSMRRQSLLQVTVRKDRMHNRDFGITLTASTQP